MNRNKRVLPSTVKHEEKWKPLGKKPEREDCGKNDVITGFRSIAPYVLKSLLANINRR